MLQHMPLLPPAAILSWHQTYPYRVDHCVLLKGIIGTLKDLITG